MERNSSYEKVGAVDLWNKLARCHAKPVNLAHFGGLCGVQLMSWWWHAHNTNISNVCILASFIQVVTTCVKNWLKCKLHWFETFV